MEDDTVKLLRECNAGVKMGISSLEDVMPHVQNRDLEKELKESKNVHCHLGERTHNMLKECHDEGKEPAAMAKVMSFVKTNVKLGGEDSDRVVADLITDGCNMGIKSLYRYLHQYPAADTASKALTEEIIHEEEKLVKKLTKFL